MLKKYTDKLRRFFGKDVLREIGNLKAEVVEVQNNVLHEIGLLSERLNEIKLPSMNDRVYIGKDYCPTRHATWDYECLAATIIKDRSTLFIDVGANKGQSVMLAYKYINNVNVLSYEPLKSCCDPYLKGLTYVYPGFRYKNIAMSSSDDPIIIQEIKQFSGLSSSLKIKEDYKYFQESINTNVKEFHEVQSTTLTKEQREWDTYNAEIRMLKIDTQGTELRILKEAPNLLRSGYFDIVKIEVMMIEKYEKSDNYLDVLNFMNECGYIIYNIVSVYRDLNGTHVPVLSLEYGHNNEYDITFVHKERYVKMQMEAKQ